MLIILNNIYYTIIRFLNYLIPCAKNINYENFSNTFEEETSYTLIERDSYRLKEHGYCEQIKDNSSKIVFNFYFVVDHNKEETLCKFNFLEVQPIFCEI